MSFSREQKIEAATVTEKNACCRRSTLLGMLSGKAKSEGDTVSLIIDGDEIVETAVALITEVYGKVPLVSSSEKGGRGKCIRFDSKSAAKYLRNFEKGDGFSSKCPTCEAAFLRGLFLAAGRVSDPSKQHSLEIATAPSRIDALAEHLKLHGLAFSRVKRHDALSLYTKRSEQIEDFFALAGMNNTVFRLMNSKINSEVRNNANRVSNCEMNNISKAVDAAARQVALIRELEERGLLGALPEDLLETAKLRVKYEDMSLSRLAMSMSPPISKSGLSHRLKRLTELAESLISKNEILK